MQMVSHASLALPEFKASINFLEDCVYAHGQQSAATLVQMADRLWLYLRATHGYSGRTIVK